MRRGRILIFLILIVVVGLGLLALVLDPAWWHTTSSNTGCLYRRLFCCTKHSSGNNHYPGNAWNIFHSP